MTSCLEFYITIGCLKFEIWSRKAFLISESRMTSGLVKLLNGMEKEDNGTNFF